LIFSELEQDKVAGSVTPESGFFRLNPFVNVCKRLKMATNSK